MTKTLSKLVVASVVAFSFAATPLISQAGEGKYKDKAKMEMKKACKENPDKCKEMKKAYKDKKMKKMKMKAKEKAKKVDD